MTSSRRHPQQSARFPISNSPIGNTGIGNWQYFHIGNILYFFNSKL